MKIFETLRINISMTNVNVNVNISIGKKLRINHKFIEEKLKQENCPSAVYEEK